MILVWLILRLRLGGLLSWLASRWNVLLARWIALGAVAVNFVLTAGIWFGNPVPVGWVAELDLEWIPRFGIHFHLALDGLSLLMLLLTFFLGMLGVLCSWKEISYRPGFFHFDLLWVLAGITGVFLTMDLFLFYFFWEVMLIPMYFLIGFWGHANRIYAVFKFFIFTQASGLLMFLAILSLYYVQAQQTGVFSFGFCWNYWRVPFHGSFPVLLFFGSHANPHVSPDWHLGTCQSHLCGFQVLYFHPGQWTLYVAGHPESLLRPGPTDRRLFFRLL